MSGIYCFNFISSGFVIYELTVTNLCFGRQHRPSKSRRSLGTDGTRLLCSFLVTMSGLISFNNKTSSVAFLAYAKIVSGRILPRSLISSLGWLQSFLLLILMVRWLVLTIPTSSIVFIGFNSTNKENLYIIETQVGCWFGLHSCKQSGSILVVNVICFPRPDSTISGT